MPGLKQRSRTLVELAQSAAFYVRARPVPVDDKAAEAAGRCAPAPRSPGSSPHLRDAAEWNETALEALCRAQAEAAGIGFSKFAQPLRVALTGSTVSPGVFEIMRVLGRDEVVGRVEDAATGRNPALPQAD